jgi:hypothetical protein
VGLQVTTAGAKAAGSPSSVRASLPASPTTHPRAQLAVLPGTTHVTLVHRAEWLASMVAAFLDAPVPETESEGERAA